jgi:hypothetical protein
MDDARSHWVGNSLVVETTNFHESQRLSEREPDRSEDYRTLDPLGA